MYILELPRFDGAHGPRVVALGSCRLRNPFSAMRDGGELRICEADTSATLTAADAVQALDVILGERQVPPFLIPYIYESDEPLRNERLRRIIEAGVDQCIVEIASPLQFSCGEFQLQQNYLSRRLVQPHRGALLAWFRTLAKTGQADEATVEDAVRKLRAAGFAADPDMVELLRGARMTRPDRAAIKAQLARLSAQIGARWTVMGAMTVPGLQGQLMTDRRALNQDVAAACEDLGLAFFDPTHFIAEYGRAMVMQDDGANLCELAESFWPVAGRRLLEFACQAPGSARQAEIDADHAAGLCRRVNQALVETHRPRLAELGESRSGLYSHYARLLEQARLIGSREQAALQLIERHLPAYDSYAVIRAGLGELALLIAASGRRAAAFEPDAQRREAIEAGRDRLVAKGLIAPEALTVHATLMPDAPLPGAVLGIGLDASQVREEAAAAPHVEKAGVFAALLIDPRLFIRLREDPSEQDRLVEYLGSLGFGARRDYFGDELVWLRRTPAGDAG